MDKYSLLNEYSLKKNDLKQTELEIDLEGLIKVEKAFYFLKEQLGLKVQKDKYSFWLECFLFSGSRLLLTEEQYNFLSKIL